MKKIAISIVSIVSILFSSFAFAGTTQEVEYFIAANELADKGYIKKQSNNLDYKVMENVLRQEIALISRRVSGVPENTGCKNIFEDVTATQPNDWVCKNVEALVENDLISRNEIFRPEDNISKAEALIMFIRSLGFDFNIDKDSSLSWQEQVVQYSVEKGIVEDFKDYGVSAKRGWVFEVANFSIQVKEEEIKKKQDKKITDEAL